MYYELCSEIPGDLSKRRDLSKSNSYLAYGSYLQIQVLSATLLGVLMQLGSRLERSQC